MQKIYLMIDFELLLPKMVFSQSSKKRGLCSFGSRILCCIFLPLTGSHHVYFLVNQQINAIRLLEG